MKISRRDFLMYCGASALALGLSSSDLVRLGEALANPSGPEVLWLMGSSCTGCSVSLLNMVSATSPKNVADLLINTINLTYHPSIMSIAGQPASEVAEKAAAKGGYILVVEGGVPTAFNGGACLAWTYNGLDVTFKDAVIKLANKAAYVISMGTCASFGGVPAAYPNETGVKSVSAVTGRKTVNIAGCPPHPDWFVWAVTQILLKKTIALDSYGRPSYIFNKTVHELCPRREKQETHTYAQEGLCLKELGCRGPETKCNCPTVLWNNKVNWCIGANALCIGCTNPDFPASDLMPGREVSDDKEEDD